MPLQTQFPTTFIRRVGGLASFSDDFSTLKAGWSGNLAVSGGQAIVTPTLGNELLTNGDFSAWTGDDPDDWPVSSEGANHEVTQRNPGDFHADPLGTGAANMWRGSGGSGLSISQVAALLNKWHRLEVDGVTTVGRYAANVGAANTPSYGENSPQFGTTLALLATTTTFTLASRLATHDQTYDSLSLKQITDFAAVRDVGFTQGYVQANVTLNSSFGGLVHYVDADNYVAVSVQYWGGSVQPMYALYKVIAGVPDFLAIIPATGGTDIFGAGLLRLTRSGNDYSATLNGSTLFTATAVNDAVFEDATQWGIFNTHADNRFDNFVAQQEV